MLNDKLQLRWKIYDKSDDFDFQIVNIPASSNYGSFIYAILESVFFMILNNT
jgi:hypothetical protein